MDGSKNTDIGGCEDRWTKIGNGNPTHRVRYAFPPEEDAIRAGETTLDTRETVRDAMYRQEDVEVS